MRQLSWQLGVGAAKEFWGQGLERVPTASIGGILLWVSYNMVKPVEIRSVWGNRFQAWLMVYTGVTVVVFGFLPGVLSAMVIFLALRSRFDQQPIADERSEVPAASE